MLNEAINNKKITIAVSNEQWEYWNKVTVREVALGKIHST